MGRIRKYWKRKRNKLVNTLFTRHRTLPVDEILRRQGLKGKEGKDEDYVRLDIAVRQLAIECYYGKNSYGFDLYERMQTERVRRPENYGAIAVERFKDLLDSFTSSGYDDRSEIELASDYSLMDGCHRFSLVLYSGLKEIPCMIRPYKSLHRYPVTWFREKGFSEDEIAIILGKMREIEASVLGEG